VAAAPGEHHRDARAGHAQGQRDRGDHLGRTRAARDRVADSPA
jgi:hypothetical protein